MLYRPTPIRFLRRLAASAALLAWACTAGAAPAPEGTVGSTLTHLFDQVQGAMTSASTSGNGPALVAGEDLVVAIEDAQNAYVDDLGKKSDGKLPPPLKSTLDQLQSAVTELASATKASLQDASTHAQQVVNALPFHPQEPHLTKFSPRFIVPGKDVYPVALKFNGSFEFAGKPEFLPSLAIKDHTYKPTSSSPQEIVFSVPVSDFVALGGDSKDFQVIAGTLSVPWQAASMLKKDLMSKKHSEKADTYKLLLGVLPARIGTVSFLSKALKTEPGKPQKATSDPYHQCSTRACGGGDDRNHSWAAHPDPGCHVIQGTATFNVNNSGGDWSKTFTGDDADLVTFTVSTGHKGGQPGTVDFTISFMETCPREVMGSTPQDVPLIWGATQTVPATAGAWSISFDAFDSRHFDLTEQSPPNAFLKIATTPTAVTLTTADPATLVWP